MSLFSLPYMTTVLIYQFYLHFVLDKGTHIDTCFDSVCLIRNFVVY